MVQIGDFELTSLSDGHFRLDGGAMFGVVPKPLWQRRTAPDDRNRITLGLRPLLVRGRGHTILIDAGIGDKMNEKDRDIYGIERMPTLEQSLAAAGVGAADVDIVIATHLHFDHIGCLTSFVDGTPQPVFTRARHYIRRGEWEDATHPHERNRASYLSHDFLPLAEAGLIDWIEEDAEIVPGISVRRTGGHTAHHQLVRIESGGRVAVFPADLMPTTAHVDEPWIMAYDLFPMETLVSKKAFLREAVGGEYAIFFEHDPAIAAGVIRLDGKRKVVEPLPS